VIPEHAETERAHDQEQRSIILPLFPMLFTITFLSSVPSIMRGVVSERESGMKVQNTHALGHLFFEIWATITYAHDDHVLQELLKIYGISNWMHWFAWVTTSSINLIIILTIIMIMFYAASVISNVWFLLVWILFILFALAMTSFLLFLASFFEKREFMRSLYFKQLYFMLNSFISI